MNSQKLTKPKQSNKTEESYHFVVVLLLHYRHDESRDDSPLDVHDIERLLVLREECDVGLVFDRDLQGIPVNEGRSSFTTGNLAHPSFVLP